MASMKNHPFTIDETKKMRLSSVGIASIFKAPLCLDLEKLDADAAFLGMPYDLGTAVRPGARYGPRGIREASTLVNSYGHEGWYDPIRDINFMGPKWKVVDCGDVDVMHTYHEQSFANCEAAVRKILLRGAIPFVMGGDHSITIPVLRAFDCYDDICVVQFDAHLDFTMAACGITEGQGSPMRRASEMKHINKLMHIGLRGIGSSKPSDFADARKYGNKIVSIREVRSKGTAAVIDLLPEAKNYYITVDIDCLDPTISVGTGSPQAYGLYYEELSEMIEGVTKKGSVIGMDLVEVAPAYDNNQLTAFYASQIFLDAMSFIFKAKENK